MYIKYETIFTLSTWRLIKSVENLEKHKTEIKTIIKYKIYKIHKNQLYKAGHKKVITQKLYEINN